MIRLFYRIQDKLYLDTAALMRMAEDRKISSEEIGQIAAVAVRAGETFIEV